MNELENKLLKDKGAKDTAGGEETKG